MSLMEGTELGMLGRPQGSNLGSPSSPCHSPFEGGQNAPEGDEDFLSQMDENGIIGLEEMSGDGELEAESDEDGGADLPWEPRAPEDGPHYDTPLEDLSCGLNELQDSESPSHSSALSLYEEDEARVLMEDWGSEEEEYDEGAVEGAGGWAVCSRPAEKLPERDRQLDMTDEEREGDNTRGCSDPALSMAMRGEDAERDGETVLRGRFQGDSRAGMSSDDPVSGLSSPCDGTYEKSGLSRAGQVRTWPLPHTLHSPREQLGSEGGVEGEILAKSGFSESLPESQSSRQSWAPPNTAHSRSEREPEESLRVEEEQEEVGGGEEETLESQPRPLPLPRQPPSPAPRRKNTPSMHRSSPVQLSPTPGPTPNHSPEYGVRRRAGGPRAGTPKSSPGYADHDRHVQLNFPLPDLSKVGPRVRIPREGAYRPPKSRAPAPRGGSGATVPLLVYKSPADIVREVLMSSGDPPQPRSPPMAPASPPLLSAGPLRRVDATVPHEFRSPEQASSLVLQLQEDYNKLLTKYAEAENTIDRLRLEAKVGLYSDPPQPSHAVQAGAVQQGSKVMTLTLPHAQRAEFSPDTAAPDPAQQRPTRVQPSPSQTLEPHAGEPIGQDLAVLARKFQTQLDSFEDLLKSCSLKPLEQMKVLTGLVQGQDSLERGYLQGRDQHRAQQQRGAQTTPFDPDREVEGQIFRLGMRLEEMREQVEQNLRAPLSPPPALNLLSWPLGASGPTPLPESPVSPVQREFGGAVGAEVSSVSGDSEGEEFGEAGEGLPSGLPPTLLRKHSRVERDFDTLMDHYQSFRELPGLLRDNTTEPDSAVMKMASLGHDGIAPGRRRTDSVAGRGAVSPRQDKIDLATPPAHSVDQLNGGISSPEPLPLPLPCPRQQDSAGGRGRRRSHGSSLGGSTASEQQTSKLHSTRTTAPSQDGLASPETDSGFLGSESIHLTPAALRHFQQGAMVSHQRKRGEESQPISRVPEPVSACGPSPLRPPMEENLETLDGPRSGQGSRGGHTTSASSSLPWTSSQSCGSEPEREQSQSLAERVVQPPIHLTQPANGQPRRQRSLSPAVPHCHGDPPMTLFSRQLTNRHEAIQSLQAEVSRLKERLQDSLRHTKPPGPVRAPPSASVVEGRPQKIHADSRSVHYRGRGEWEDRVRGAESEEQKRWRDRDPPVSALRKRSASVPRQRPELGSTTDSEHAQTVPKVRSSRHIPEARATQKEPRQDGPRAKTHRGPYTRQLYKLMPPAGCMKKDGQNQSSQIRSCPSCHQGRVSASQSSQPTADYTRTVGGVCLAVSPPPVQGSVPLVPCVPACPSVLYLSSPMIKAGPLYPQPLCLSVDGGIGAARRVGDRRHARSLSLDSRSLSQSLTRAIEAAHGVRAASRSISHSLASGLRQQGVISQSYLY